MTPRYPRCERCWKRDATVKPRARRRLTLRPRRPSPQPPITPTFRWGGHPARLPSNPHNPYNPAPPRLHHPPHSPRTLPVQPTSRSIRKRIIDYRFRATCMIGCHWLLVSQCETPCRLLVGMANNDASCSSTTQTNATEPPMRLEVREIHPDEQEAVQAMLQDRVTGQPSGTDPSAPTPDLAQATLCIVACLEDQMIGAILCTQETPSGHVYHLPINNPAAQRWIVKSLVDKALLRLNAQGVRRYRIQMPTQDDAKAHWENFKWGNLPRFCTKTNTIHRRDRPARSPIQHPTSRSRFRTSTSRRSATSRRYCDRPPRS